MQLESEITLRRCTPSVYGLDVEIRLVEYDTCFRSGNPEIASQEI